MKRLRTLVCMDGRRHRKMLDSTLYKGKPSRNPLFGKRFTVSLRKAKGAVS
jgi:hypothetical protein